MKTRLHLITVVALCCSLSGCHNPWMEKVLVALYRIGDTGPGGGIVFYRSAKGFTMTDTGETCYFLEAAPVDLVTYAWASSAYTNTDIPGTGTSIGSGRQNTARILSADSAAPAAYACKNYTGGGKTDWFLPSFYELNELCKQNAVVGGYYTYWSSSQYDSTNAWTMTFYLYPSAYSKGSYYNVRAIRAF